MRLSDVGYVNYVASLGSTAAQQVGSQSYQESNTNRLGIFNVTIDTGQPKYLNPPTNTQSNFPNYLRALPVTVAAVTDGTSNTAAFSETQRSHAATASTVNGLIGGIRRTTRCKRTSSPAATISCRRSAPTRAPATTPGSSTAARSITGTCPTRVITTTP